MRRGAGIALAVFVAVSVVATLLLGWLHTVLHVSVFPLVSLAPAIAGLAVWALPRSWRPEWPEAVAYRQWRAHTLLGLGAAAMFLLLMFALFSLTGTPVPALGALPAGGLIAALIGAIASAVVQEFGWRGALQPTLERWMPRIFAALITGLVWGLWAANYGQDALGVVAVVLTYTLLGILLGYLGNGSLRQRVSTAAIVHAFFAITFFTYGSFTGRTAQVLTLLSVAIVTAVFMAMFVIATRRRRAKQEAEAPPISGARHARSQPRHG